MKISNAAQKFRLVINTESIKVRFNKFYTEHVSDRTIETRISSV